MTHLEDSAWMRVERMSEPWRGMAPDSLRGISRYCRNPFSFLHPSKSWSENPLVPMGEMLLHDVEYFEI